MNPLQLFSQWDPHAGVPYWISTPPEVIEASSELNSTADRVVDGDLNTQWLSEKPLPNKYVNRTDQNILFQLPDSMFMSTGGTTFSKLTDGNLTQLTYVNPINGTARLDINIPEDQSVLLYHLKAATTANIDVYAHTSINDSTFIGTYTTSNAYSWKRFDVDLDGVLKISLQASGAFSPFEMAALADYPKEYLIVDLKDTMEVGYLKTRHWAGWSVATATKLYLSLDQSSWTEVASLDPSITNEIITKIDNPQLARYVKIEHTLTSQDYKNVYVWELSAFSVDGPYGEIPAAQASSVTVRELLGINTIWGWGHDEYADLLNAGEGPELHKSYANYARYYHNMSWDVIDPDSLVDYTDMALGNGTQATWWLNWDREYETVAADSLNIYSTIKIGNFDASAWDNPYQSAYDYGYNFASHFGPTNGNNTVQMLEVGNEPWYYDSLTYRQVLDGMSDGVKAADSSMLVFPCALQAFNPDADNEEYKNYIGTKLTATEADNIDGLNIHAYSWVVDNSGTRVGTYPEYGLSTFHEIYSMIRFRDQNMPGKPIYLTEWGWDTAGAGENCTHSECVSEDAGAVYAVRGALMALRLGIERATWYFYGNFGSSSLFSRSGTTGSEATNFAKKKNFKALEALTYHLGDSYFQTVIQEDNQAWIYQMADSSGNPTHIVAWRPIDGDSTGTINVAIPSPLSPAQAFILDGGSSTGTSISLPTYSNGEITVTIGTAPTIIALNQAQSFVIPKQSTIPKVAFQAEVQADWDFNLAPNPSRGFINIDILNQKKNSGIFQLEIMDLYGRQIYTTNLNNGQLNLDLNSLSIASGYYLVRLKDEAGTVKTKKLIMKSR